jgi:hypothetical protein
VPPRWRIATTKKMNVLNIKAFVGLLCLFLAMSALIFIPARTLEYWQAWTFLVIYFGCSLAITLYLMESDPRLLQRRMSGDRRLRRSRRRRSSCFSRRWDLPVFCLCLHSIIASSGRA